jgi:isopentenyl-diphosphate delta-isomerase
MTQIKSAQLQFPEEMLDLVNDQDEVIGVMERNEVYARGLHNFRVINAFVRRSDGALFIPRRQSNKRLFPNALDVSVGGHVSSGETYLEAFRKEACEELNLDIDAVSYRVLGTMNPATDGVSAFMTVYEIFLDDTPQYNTEDFSYHLWLTPFQVFQQLEGGDTSKDDLPKLLKRFY